MDFKKIKKLVSLVETSDISSLSVEEDQLKVEIKRELNTIVTTPHIPTQPTIQVPTPTSTPPPETNKEPDEQKNTNLIEIKSPMVGTFYTSPNPESPPFVSNGSNVKQGEVICIIEAMKLFNEIESDFNGTIEKVCIENGEPVEFDQPLFLIRKN